MTSCRSAVSRRADSARSMAPRRWITTPISSRSCSSPKCREPEIRVLCGVLPVVPDGTGRPLAYWWYVGACRGPSGAGRGRRLPTNLRLRTLDGGAVLRLVVDLDEALVVVGDLLG